MDICVLKTSCFFLVCYKIRVKNPLSWHNFFAVVGIGSCTITNGHVAGSQYSLYKRICDSLIEIVQDEMSSFGDQNPKMLSDVKLAIDVTGIKTRYVL